MRTTKKGEKGLMAPDSMEERYLMISQGSSDDEASTIALSPYGTDSSTSPTLHICGSSLSSQKGMGRLIALTLILKVLSQDLNQICYNHIVEIQ